MRAEGKVYTRLTRNVSGFAGYSSLWLAADHLMLVRSTGYNESYSRVALTDIKGFFLTSGDRRIWWTIVWGVVCGIGLNVGGFVLIGGGVPVFSAIVFALGLAGLIWNHALGRGCRAYVVTGVQTARLHPLVRIKKARRVIAQLQPLIVAAQSERQAETGNRGQEAGSGVGGG